MTNVAAEPLEIRLIPIETLLPYAKNARIHPEAHVKQIAASIKEFGFRDPVEVSSDNIIIAGHGRVLALQMLGAKQVPCIVHGDLDKSAWRAYNLVNNKLTDNSEWDLELLRGELEELKIDFDFEELGFNLSEFLPEPEIHPPGEGEEDAIPENVETRCKPGDLWILGDHRLLCGDSTNIQHVDRLMNGEKADMVFTDPPYNVAYSGRGKNNLGTIKNDDMSEDDFTDFLRSVFSCYSLSMVPLAPIYVCHPDSASAPKIAFEVTFAEFFKKSSTIIWVKQSAGMGWQDYRAQHEPIIYGWLRGEGKHYFIDDRSKTTIWEIGRDSQASYVHPTQKPVSLPEEAILNSSKTGNKVLDLFGGSGSTLIACEKTGRKCYGMEIDPHYCSVIIERWEKYSGKTAVLEESNGR